MKTTKKIAVSKLTIATVANGDITTPTVLTQESDASNLAQRLACRFGLSETDVKCEINKYRLEKEADLRKWLEQSLAWAVINNKLTNLQSRKILAKFDIVKKKLEDIKNVVNQESRRSLVKQLRANLKQWAKDNNIPEVWLTMGGQVRGFGRLRV